jgi:lysyl-tRNA synthetase class 2
MNRQDYLKNHWKPYPPAPSEALYSGRVIGIQLLSDQNLLKLKIEKNQRISEFSVSDTALAEILQPGDLIAVDGQKKVLLMAPGQPVRPAASRQKLQLWQGFLQAVRLFFSRQDFLEIQTPTLVVCPGTEPTIEVFSTLLKKGSQQKQLFLPTSPELHLKKALCLGFDKIFEIKNCFRNDENSPHHQPEFTLLEWYRTYKNLQSMEVDIRELFRFLMEQFDQEIALRPESIRVATVAELFYEHTGFKITPQSSLEDYQKIALESGVKVRGAESIDDYFFATFIEKIEPKLPLNQLLFVKDYPPFQAALARLTENGWADRMEVYFGGLELANGFHELNDPKEQKHRFELDLEKKKALGKSPINLDSDFIELLQQGMPPAAGMALGVERLFMALFEVVDIRELRLFPYE